MNFTDFSELRSVVEEMKINVAAETEIRSFKTKGLKTDLSDVYPGPNNELFTKLKDGSIRKCIVHICDITSWPVDYGLPKFHIFECTTLSEMRENSRQHRYRKASRNDGKFWVIRGQEKSYAILNICFNCLKLYNHVYFENENVGNFNIKNYIQQPSKHSEPYITVASDMATIPKRYAGNWKEISTKMKEQCNWMCQVCFCDLSDNKKYLHTHHINADISNNDYENLKVVCIECHAKEFNHDHLKTT